MRCAPLFMGCLISVLAAASDASIIDLNPPNFTADPMVVTVSQDGSMAEIREDNIVFFFNDPGLGDPEIIVPQKVGVPQVLTFDYMFTEPQPDNVDQFVARLFDADDFLNIPTIPGFELFVDETESGSIRWDLTPLIGGPTLGLEFSLFSATFAGDAASTSTVKISNVRLEPIPEPSSIAAWSVLLAIAGTTRRRRGQGRVVNR